jgi:hypothetical protein
MADINTANSPGSGGNTDEINPNEEIEQPKNEVTRSARNLLRLKSAVSRKGGLPTDSVTENSSDLERAEGDRIDLNANISAKYAQYFRLGALQTVRPSNSENRIKNPLADIPKAKLLRDVEEFANQNKLGHIVTDLQKGALIAQDPTNFESVEGLQEDEANAIRNEVLHKWRHPRPLYFTIILCSIGAAVQ